MRATSSDGGCRRCGAQPCRLILWSFASRIRAGQLGAVNACGVLAHYSLASARDALQMNAESATSSTIANKINRWSLDPGQILLCS